MRPDNKSPSYLISCNSNFNKLDLGLMVGIDHVHCNDILWVDPHVMEDGIRWKVKVEVPLIVTYQDMWNMFSVFAPPTPWGSGEHQWCRVWESFGDLPPHVHLDAECQARIRWVPFLQSLEWSIPQPPRLRMDTLSLDHWACREKQKVQKVISNSLDRSGSMHNSSSQANKTGKVQANQVQEAQTGQAQKAKQTGNAREHVHGGHQDNLAKTAQVKLITQWKHMKQNSKNSETNVNTKIEEEIETKQIFTVHYYSLCDQLTFAEQVIESLCMPGGVVIEYDRQKDFWWLFSSTRNDHRMH